MTSQPVEEPPITDPVSVHEVLTKMVGLLTEIHVMMQKLSAPAAPTPPPQAKAKRVSDDQSSMDHPCVRCGKPLTKILGTDDKGQAVYACRSCREPGHPRARPQSY